MDALSMSRLAKGGRPKVQKSKGGERRRKSQEQKGKRTRMSDKRVAEEEEQD